MVLTCVAAGVSAAGLAVSTNAASALGQPSPQPRHRKPFRVGEYSKARSHFPNPIAPYVGRTVTVAQLDEYTASGPVDAERQAHAVDE